MHTPSTEWSWVLLWTAVPHLTKKSPKLAFRGKSLPHHPPTSLIQYSEVKLAPCWHHNSNCFQRRLAMKPSLAHFAKWEARAGKRASCLHDTSNEELHSSLAYLWDTLGVFFSFFLPPFPHEAISFLLFLAQFSKS